MLQVLLVVWPLLLALEQSMWMLVFELGGGLLSFDFVLLPIQGDLLPKVGLRSFVILPCLLGLD